MTSAQRLGLRPVTDWIEGLGETDWQRLSAGEGAKGPRLYDWAYRPYAGGAKGFRCGLLVRRSIADPGKITFYLTHAPEGTTLDELVKIAGTRWSIESLFEDSKGRSASTSMRCAPGPDGTVTSPSPCWPSPISRPSERAPSGGVDLKSRAEDLLPLTVPEVRHLIAAVIAPALPRSRATVPLVRLAPPPSATRQTRPLGAKGLEAA